MAVLEHLAESGPYERIVETARELFFKQGFAATTVNQLIAESGTHKASFYRYFADKDAVAVEYLRREKEAFANMIRLLTHKAKNPADFIVRWNALTRKQVRSNKFHGCRVSRLVQTLEGVDKSLQLQAAEVIEYWIDTLERYLQAEKLKGHFKGNPRRTAEKFIRLFQGTAAMYRLQNKEEVFAYFEEDMLSEVRN